MASPHRLYPSRVLAISAAAVLLWLSGCSDQTSAPQIDGILLAPGGGGAPPRVDEAIPPSAEQDTTLDVRVLGSNFDDGSAVEFTIDGVAQVEVRTNSVTFVSESELLSNITIDDTAAVDLYDVEVTSTRGKKGIGADKFSVVEKSTGPPQFEADPATIVTMPDPDNSAVKIRGDGRGDYVGDDCGVHGKIFSPEDGAGSGDAVMDPDAEKIKGKDRSRCGDPRTITVIFDTPLSGAVSANPIATGGFFQNMNKLWQAPQDTSLSEAGFNVGRCNIVRFKPSLYPGSDSVVVVRTGDVWVVSSQPDEVLGDGTVIHHDKAWCADENRFYHLPFTLTVRLQ